MGRERAIVALSGGLDSSVTALLLKEAGYEVSGVHMQLWDTPQCIYQERHAEQICRVLNIPFSVIDVHREFEHYVINHFCQEYESGQTPNPCIACNKHIKFGFLLNKALALGADYLATGHYASIEYSGNSYHLLKANDDSKDQSYFLYNLTQEKLKYLLFPLGKYSKLEVKKLAKEKELPVSSNPSQDLCFIADKNYHTFLSQRFATKPGDIVHSTGEILGRHRGVAFYTIGQRHGLGTASEKPLYVIRIESDNNHVVLGSEEELYSQQATVKELNWVTATPPAELSNITAKIRYRSLETPVTISSKGENINVWFPQPQRAVTPGQAIVFYNGDELIGGGVIENFSPISPTREKVKHVPANQPS